MSTAPLAVLVNGRADGTVDILDRGLHYGDGLFETLAVVGGRIQLWDRHLRRLEEGCRRLRLPLPDPAALFGEAQSLCTGRDRAVLKVLLTRGPGARGYRIDRSASAPTRLLLLYSAPAYPAEHWRDGVAVRRCATRLGTNPALAGIKHLNRLEQVLARDEWDDPEIAEGLMLDQHERVVSGTMSNVFAVRDGRLLTPALSDCGVAGIMRGLVLETAAGWGVETAQASLVMAELLEADEVFLSNSLFGVWPVRSIDATPLQAGPVARRLAAALGACSLAPLALTP